MATQTITELLTTIAENEIKVYEAGIKAAKEIYSSTPTVVGEWINGEPVKRVGFETTIPAHGAVNVDVVLQETSAGIRILDCECFSTTANPDASTTHHRKSEISFETTGVMNVSYENDTDESVLYGWIEYAVPASETTSAE